MLGAPRREREDGNVERDEDLYKSDELRLSRQTFGPTSLSEVILEKSSAV